MVKGKRGQIFSLMMVFFTLFLCGVVIVLYVVQQGNAHASLVSPADTLMLRDKLDIFEMREVELIKSSLGGAKDFGGSFKGSFIDGVMADDDMRNFIFDGLFLGGVEVREQDKTRNLLEDGIYSVWDDSSFSRAKIEKRGLLVAKNESKIDFPVDFSFEFGRSYLINKNGEVTKV